MSRTTKQKGDDYENFVCRIYTSIKKIEEIGLIKCSRIEQHKKVPAKYGTPREIDLYWEYEMEGEIKKTAIECKGYKSRVTIEKLDAFHTKLQDTGIDNGIFCALSGYQAGAIDSAKYHNITVLELREAKEEDWKDKIARITLTMKISTPIVEELRVNLTSNDEFDKGVKEIPHEDDNIYNKKGEVITTCQAIMMADFAKQTDGVHVVKKEFSEETYMRINGKMMILNHIYIRYRKSTSTQTTMISKVANAILKHIGHGEYMIFDDGSFKKISDT